MEKLTEGVAQAENIDPSFQLQAYVAVAPRAPIPVALDLARFKAFPEDAVRKVVSYLPLSERSNLFMRTSDKQRSIFTEGLAKERLIDSFIHIMTLESPDNQSKAEAMLKQFPQLATRLITTNRMMYGDIAQQFSTTMSAYQYAWWVDDTSMCCLLDEYLNEVIKAELLQQCEAGAPNKFIYLITRESENNQNKAEAILDEYPHLVSQLISEQVDTRDTVRHFIEPISAYEYAYWSGDTRMRTMLNKYIHQDEALKTMVYEQCKNIKENGIAFEMLSTTGKPLPNSTVTHSKHFDYQPLKDAYTAYNAEAFQLTNAHQYDDEAWMQAAVLWLNVGKAWAKIPVSGMQEICAPTFFMMVAFPYMLTDISLLRTVKFYNLISHKNEYLVSRGVINADLGESFSIYKALGWATPGLNGAAGGRPGLDGEKWWCRDNMGAPGVDSKAVIVVLCKARTDDDLKQTLLELEPAEPRARLSL